MLKIIMSLSIVSGDSKNLRELFINYRSNGKRLSGVNNKTYRLIRYLGRARKNKR